MAASSSFAAEVDPVQYQDLDFRMIGPYRGGRVTAVAGVAQNTETYFMGATGGGVWKTTNGGTTWNNVSDGYFATASIGAIAVAPSDPNVVWVGTGTACLRSNIIIGKGVYRSTDGGQSWQHLGLDDAGQIGDLVVHPQDPETAWVAAVGAPFAPNPTRGVFRTRDGGQTWQHVLAISDRVGAVDLALDQSNPRRLFAAAWRAERKPWTIISGSQDSGLFVTGDGGDSWKAVSGGLPEGVVGKIAIEISPADPQRVWALVEAPEEEPGTARGLYRSDDGGRTFAFVNGQPSLTYRPFYYMHLTADPRDRDRIWVNNETLWLSRDGGVHFEAVATPHGDNHAMWIHPTDPRYVVQGNDGGANVSRDGGVTWSAQWNQPTAELYQVAVDEGFPYRVYGAQQDNTTISVPSRLTRRPLDPKQNWLEVAGCETGPVLPHPDQAGLVYGGCKGRHSVFDAATGQVQQYWVYPHFNYGHDTRDMPVRFQRVAPVILSPHDSSVLYHASQYVHRSGDHGQTWETISPDLTAFDDETQGYSGGPIARDITGEEIYSALYALAESPLEAGVLWAGSNDGPIHLSRDAGRQWQEVTPTDLPKGGRVNRIEASPHRADRAWVAVYRYLLGDFRPYLYRADDYGSTWTLLSGPGSGIPQDHPVRVVREDPMREGLVYVGTEFGLYVSWDFGESFVPLQFDLPRGVPISGLVVHRGDLVVATMGRSFWILDDLGPLRHAKAGALESRLLPPREAHRVGWVEDLSRQFPGYAPDYTGSSAAIDYVLGADVDELRLSITDSQGELVFSVHSGDQDQSGANSTAGGGQSAGLGLTRGHHRLHWDLRGEGVLPWRSDDEGSTGRRTRTPMVAPGSYVVRLQGRDLDLQQQLTVILDPRLEAAGVSESQVREQVALHHELLRWLARLRESARSLELLDSDLQRFLERPDVRGQKDVIAELAALSARAREAQEVLVQPRLGKVGAELQPRLEGQIEYLIASISGADQPPGAESLRRWNDLRTEVEEALAEARAVWPEVERVEQILEDVGLQRFRREDD